MHQQTWESTVFTTIDKVYEQLMSKQATEYFEPVLSQSRTAYRKQHSCKTSLLRLVENWKLAIDNKEFVSVLAVDMSKAFDSLFLPLLLNKLKAYGFSENAPVGSNTIPFPSTYEQSKNGINNNHRMERR